MKIVRARSAWAAAILVLSASLMAASGGAEGIIDNAKELFNHIQLFSDSITLISTDYVKPVKAKDLVYGAIRGMMDDLDGYSQFLDPDSFKEITEETKGEFGGIGIEIGVRDGVLTVIAPIEDTPAFVAGIQAGDRIVKIDDKITRDMTLSEAVDMMRGAPGSKVKLIVARDGSDKMPEFEIIRDYIKLRSIKESRMIDGNIGYVKIVGFQEKTARDLRDELHTLAGDGAQSFVLDIRNNPGGLLDAAVETADLFLEQGKMIVYTEGRDPADREEFISKSIPEFGDQPLIIIVNKGAASAAEILAGAVKDNARGLLVGTSTFGKGSVQTVIPLQDSSALRLTTAAYYTPSGKNLMDRGVEPDIFVERGLPPAKDEDSEAEERKEEIFSRLEDEPEEKKEEPKPEETDAQLRAAINIIKGVHILDGYRTPRAAKVSGATDERGS